MCVPALLLHSQPPSITCPTSQTLIVAINASTVMMPDLTSGVASDNCGISASVIQSPAKDASLGPGLYDVSFTATDVNGNTATSICATAVTVVDPTVS